MRVIELNRSCGVLRFGHFKAGVNLVARNHNELYAIVRNSCEFNIGGVLYSGQPCIGRSYSSYLYDFDTYSHVEDGEIFPDWTLIGRGLRYKVRRVYVANVVEYRLVIEKLRRLEWYHLRRSWAEIVSTPIF